MIHPIQFLEKDEIIKIVTYPEARQDFYMITNYGKVFTTSYGNFREKKVNKDKDGYLQTEMIRPNEINKPPKPMRIHQLVAYEFVEKENDDQILINHKDGNKENCYYKNLEYCTPSENNLHAFDMGLSPSGEDHHWNKYNEELIHYICNLLSLGFSNQNIRDALNITRESDSGINNLIKDLRRRKVWRQITNLYSY